MRAVTVLRPSFSTRLTSASDAHRSLLCVGLDPEPESWPDSFPRNRTGALGFCREIVDAVADLVCAFKPQAAHFGALGAENELAELIRYIHERHPAVPVILDAKRGDIGSTAQRYAVEVFERYDADAVTVNPYLGPESIEPYRAYRDRGVFVLCRTSNAGSDWLQSYGNEPLYLRVARGVVEWNSYGNLALVTGATYPADIARIRRAAGDLPLLVPGLGAQGGELRAVLAGGLDSARAGLVMSASRSVLYAGKSSSRHDYPTAAREAAQTLRDEINHAIGELHGARNPPDEAREARTS